MIKLKLLTILFLSVLSFSCKKEILNPDNIPSRTIFKEEPIANLAIPSKDATVKVKPVESIYQTGNTYLIYNCYHVFFDFNGKYYITAIDKCDYDANAKTVKYTNIDFHHLLEIDINDDFKMKEVTNYFATRNNPETNDLYNKIQSIVNGEAWTNANKIYIQTNGQWYSSSDITNWQAESNKPADAKQKAKTELYKIPIKAGNGKTYTYAYAAGGKDFSITRLTNRMRQQANRLEYQFDFKNEDFNNHHMFDLGLNTDGITNAKFRLNPTNYIGNDTNYVYMGATSADGQLWIMPVKKDGKDYLIRLVEHGGPEMYLISDLQSNTIKYKAEYQKSLAKSLELSSTNANINDIRNAAYETIFNDANYKANKYFLDVVNNMGAKGGDDGIYVSSSKPITHYVIEIVDIE
ncbi:hypothetical protein [Brachyspira aalborgi]|uniref:DUF4374 domain-containing protein n=1 Tax=Brachyspira aalborgi TaxID=29522 RepID=A0A5C8CJ47_9SPIR|nr:hypothetical protein [Brachyspira aalborgi]TXJ12925.1 hypothetical protein EPJ80_04825 [Brachyspira aalborgi]